MTKPKKQTVAWFPHSSSHGRTMFTLEKRYGIAGYGFWFKLLEIMANTEGHFIDAEDPATLEFISAHTYTEKESCLEVLNLLATLDAIDPELWECKIIWSDHFVEGLLPLYRKRECNVPTKPDKRSRMTQTLGQKEPVDHRKIDREIDRKKERKDIAPPGTVVPIGALFFSCPYFSVDLDYRLKLAKEYPALKDDPLRRELSKMEDWISDNSGKKKFKANGNLANPKLFIKNWLSRVEVQGHGGQPMSKAEQVTADNMRAAREVMKDYE